jgi:hypothetical protein
VTTIEPSPVGTLPFSGSPDFHQALLRHRFLLLSLAPDNATGTPKTLHAVSTVEARMNG